MPSVICPCCGRVHEPVEENGCESALCPTCEDNRIDVFIPPSPTPKPKPPAKSRKKPIGPSLY
jgi:hypothetical protein